MRNKNQITVSGSNILSNEQIIVQKGIFMEFARSIIPDFKIDESNRENISDLFNYFLKLPGRLDPSKGLWLMGDIGTGKSSLMQVFSKYMIAKHDGFLIHDCSHVANQYSISGDLDKYTYNQTGYHGEPVWMCFDELGRESIPANHFGQKLNVMQHILSTRYSLWQTEKVKTFVTTNLDAIGVEGCYGDYIRDRCREMFNLISFTGESRR
ncbi:conserved hypothetical protein [uncultured Dysgonomonas sp.]|uniref:ATPase AAA-type core domain-containing protein n=1 Tax=uncultured Dysgonomonas sp. TaxID=206096 RepID=A0A212JWT3_9BACT|nr:hypothetical protein [uncultured Dysgonomonas sp.]SBW03812.1 conserved hypothetical protein [uncultured Dysgonomonas sp.]